MSATDESVERLAALFAAHPAWVEAAGRLSDRATSSVYFSHRPGEVFRLEQQRGETRLLPGAARDPDLVFRFSPASIERLDEVEGGVGEFAVALFELILEEEETLRVGLRIVAGFPRLAMRGYVGLVVAAGPAVVAFGASHGIRTLSGLRRLVAEVRSRGPAEWEVE